MGEQGAEKDCLFTIDGLKECERMPRVLNCTESPRIKGTQYK